MVDNEQRHHDIQLLTLVPPLLNLSGSMSGSMVGASGDRLRGERRGEGGGEAILFLRHSGACADGALLFIHVALALMDDQQHVHSCMLMSASDESSGEQKIQKTTTLGNVLLLAGGFL